MSLSLTESIHIDAPVSKVWQAITDPSLVQQYFFGSRTESNFQKGSPIVWRGEWQGKSYEDKGLILESVENQMLKHSYWSSLSGTPDVPESYMHVTYKLDRLDEKSTLLSVTQEGLRDETQVHHSRANWRHVLEALKAVVERV